MFFLSLSQKETNFVTSCLFTGKCGLSEMMSTCKGKNLLLGKQNQSFTH